MYNYTAVHFSWEVIDVMLGLLSWDSFYIYQYKYTLHMHIVTYTYVTHIKCIFSINVCMTQTHAEPVVWTCIWLDFNRVAFPSPPPCLVKALV